MTSKVYVITDLGPGDGGKGGVVHKVARMSRAHTIIKKGGAQGSHGVRTAAGDKFNFSQWGCGTFEGIPTHLSSQIVVAPEGILNEAAALKYEHGIYDPFQLLTADESALVATPFHGIASRLFELARGKNPRGTIGTGVGQAFRDADRYPDLALTVGDLRAADLHSKLKAVRDNVSRYVWPVVEDAEFLRSDSRAVRDELALLGDDGFVDYVVDRFQQVARAMKIVPVTYMGEVILAKPGSVVVETSHGVLTDRLAGFHPHTSAIRTLPHFTSDMLRNAGYSGPIVNIGVTRAYAIRHGAGPMPTNDPELAEQLLPGSHKDENRWQGKVRVGPMDLPLLRYALAASGGAQAFDGLAITWFDQVAAVNTWQLCHRYEGTSSQRFFDSSGDMRVHYQAGLTYQQELGEAVAACTPVISQLSLSPNATRNDLFELCDETLQSALGVAVRMVSFGPTERDKLAK